MKVAIAVSTPQSQGATAHDGQSERPRRDFVALASALNATIIAPTGPANSTSRIRYILRSMKIAFDACRRRHEYDVIVSDVDLLGLCVALMLKLTRSRANHLMISHGELGEPKYVAIARWLRLMSRIDRVVCYGPAAAYAILESGLAEPEKISLIKHAADSQFWRTDHQPDERLIVAAGLEHRDYTTLIEAVDGMDVNLIIAAASPWSRDHHAISSLDHAEHEGLPTNVQVVTCSPAELRDLYARAYLVAVPLRETFDQSGSLVVYEAMSMGRPVIATRTTGQEALGIVREDETGFLVEIGDVQAWRDRIADLINQPEKAARFGYHAREIVESELNLDEYVRQMTELVRSLANTAPDTSLQSSTIEP